MEGSAACYIYICFTGRTQDRETHLERLRQYAADRGMVPVEEFLDTAPERTGLLRLRHGIKGCGTAFVIAEALAQLGRGTADVLHTLRQIRRDGAQLICMEEGVDTAEQADGFERLETLAAKLPWSESAVCSTAAYFRDGDALVLESNAIKQNKMLMLTADIRTPGAIDLHHGKERFGASGIVIDATKIQCYNYTTERNVTRCWEHGLTIGAETAIVLTVGEHADAYVSVTSNGHTFAKGEIPWIGTVGSIGMESIGAEMENVRLCWDCSNYLDDLWLFGDSYFTYYAGRWPYHVLKEYDSFLLSGFPGAPSAEIYKDFSRALTHATPKMAVWCLGMNDPDSEDGISQSWKFCTERFLAECRDRKIVPVLATIPNVPERIHIHKNAYVRSSGCRYIDFAAAVGAEEKGSSWFAGMLYSDLTHPAVCGAEALARQVIKDLPEITGKSFWRRS